MSKVGRIHVFILVSMAIMMTMRAAQAQTPKPEHPAKPVEAAKPAEPVKPAEAVKPAAAPAKETPLKLTGLTMTVPQGWVEEKIEPSPMGPKAVFKIPRTDPNGEDGMVRITHYPDMKGKDDMNIDRWLGQVSKPDGQPLTRSDAKITTTEVGKVRLTVVDMSGSAKLTMRDTAKPNQRMIAAIVDHPQGPHFVVSAGPAASMEKWAAQIDAFLKSAKVE